MEVKQLELVKASRENLQELTSFLAKMNNHKSAHIGFCGEKAEEIQEQLMSDFSDLPLDESFILAYKNARLVGALGLDIDLEQGYAEVWGPFVEHEDADTAQKMWDSLTRAIPKEVNRFSFFVNEENRFVKDFLARNKGVNQGAHTILEMKRESFAHEGPSKVGVYNENYEHSFKRLHNQAFPSTYFDGDTIVKRLSETNQLFLATKNEQDITGYVYIEANPEHQEAAIEYIAVADERRKEGIGKSLLTAAVDHIFLYPQINQVTLSVSRENAAAIHLYLSVGFKGKYNLIGYDLVLTYV